MKKIIISLALLLTAALSANAQLLYKISGNGLTHDSYIIGTYHLAPVSFADSIPGLQAALDATEQVCGELEMSDMTLSENTMKMQKAMMLVDGKRSPLCSPLSSKRSSTPCSQTLWAPTSPIQW